MKTKCLFFYLAFLSRTGISEEEEEEEMKMMTFHLLPPSPLIEFKFGAGGKKYPKKRERERLTKRSGEGGGRPPQKKSSYL